MLLMPLAYRVVSHLKFGSINIVLIENRLNVKFSIHVMCGLHCVMTCPFVWKLLFAELLSGFYRNVFLVAGE